MLFPWEAGYAEQQSAIRAAGKTHAGKPLGVKVPEAGWAGQGYSLQHRRETVDIQQGQILEMGLGFNVSEARTLAVAAAERHDRRS